MFEFGGIFDEFLMDEVGGTKGAADESDSLGVKLAFAVFLEGRLDVRVVWGVGKLGGEGARVAG